MANKLLKNQKGIIVADSLVSILIMTIFGGIISMLCYNIYIASSFTKRNSAATNYGVQIVEYIDKIEYDNVTYDDLKNYINKVLDDDKSNISAEVKENEKELTTPYRVSLEIQKYNEIPGNIGKEDLIKIITIEIKYNLADIEKVLTFERIKQRQNLD